MNINKFTLAAALSIGIMASTATAGLTEDFTTDTSSNILAACPCACPTPVTPQTAKCPTCLQDNCKCKPACDPCNTCNTCDPCNTCKTCEPCCEPCNPCPPMAECPKPTEPTCAVCPNTQCECEKFKQQVYAYPNAVYGTNQIIGERQNSVVIGTANLNQAKGCNPVMTCGCGDITGAAIDIPTMGSNSNCGCMTGAACGCQGVPVAGPCDCPTGAAMPMIDQTCGCQGIPVDRSCNKLDGACCPVQIHTCTSQDICKKSLVPFTISTPTGAAVPLVSAFDDVPSGFWAGCDINKLTTNNVIAGYPDRTFKPNLPVSRAEMASLIVKGFNLNDKMTCPEKVFKDVPQHHWANNVINKAVANGVMTGYPDCTFKPGQPISRAEALTILSKGISCPMDECKAKDVLSQYCDACSVPSWATIPIAKSLEAGANSDLPQPNIIAPNKDASRAEIASMLENVRVTMGYSKDDQISQTDCGCTGGAAYMAKDEVITVPTLKICFADEISAKSATVGDQFAAETIDQVTIDGNVYPAGSMVRGKVLEVVRPDGCDKGALRLSFNTIESCGCNECKADLPNQVLAAQVNCENKRGPISRLIQFPFNWIGRLVGTTTRTVGGALVSLGNAAETVVQGTGVGTSELLTGQFKAGGRSYQDALKATVKAPIDLTRTALSGATGLMQVSGDELTYLVNPKGMKVSSVNPKEKVTIAFGCCAQK